MNAYLPALRKVESADLGAVPAGWFCLGVMGGNFLPPRHQDTKKERVFSTKARRHEERGGLPRSAGRRLANLGALCGFVVQSLPLTAGRVWLKGGRLLVFGSYLGCAGVAESASYSGFCSNEVAASIYDSGFCSNEVAASVNDSGFRSNEVAASINDSGFCSEISNLSSKCCFFDVNRQFSSENDAILHADTLPAAPGFLPVCKDFPPLTTNQQQTN